MRIEREKNLDLERERLVSSLVRFWMRQDKDTVYIRYDCASKMGREIIEKELSWVTHLVVAYGENGEVLGLAEGVKTGCVVSVSVVVDGECRGKGLGRELIQKLIDEARTDGVRMVCGEYLPQNKQVDGMVMKLVASGCGRVRFENPYKVFEIDL